MLKVEGRFQDERGEAVEELRSNLVLCAQVELRNIQIEDEFRKVKMLKEILHEY